MVLVDTSVWIDHFRKASPHLVSLLEHEEVAMHPFIIGELACGNLQNRQEILASLRALPATTKADGEEILFFIERHALMGRGIGLIDTHVLAAACMDGCALWTRDRRLRTVAEELGVGFGPPPRGA